MGTVTLSPEQARHAVGSRRLRRADALILIDGLGHLAEGTVEEVRPDGVRVHVSRLCAVPPPLLHPLTIITALPRGKRQDYLFEKCTELGVGTLAAANFARSVARARREHLPRWRRTCVEGAKQSGQAWAPRLDVAEPLESYLASVPQGAARLIAEPHPSVVPLAEALAGVAPAQPLVCLVGPEGGFTPQEQTFFADRDFTPICLAPAVLRIETACVVLAAAVQACLAHKESGRC
jgi:16S rRNA (uracil1498-N3)-methyltransferase